MAGSDLGTPPQSDEIEISLFGPGYGESIVLHVGNNEWIIVDSCIDSPAKQSTPLEYLRQLGVSAAVGVKLVVATHWHDDHIRGLGSVLNSCESAEFVCSEALRPAEFLTLVTAYGSGAMMDTTGISEFTSIVEILKRRTQARGRESPPRWAIADRCLWRTGSELEPNCEVYALSPSDAYVLIAHREISALVTRAKSPKLRLGAQSPNHTAVVLWVRIGEVALLLGSDLEDTNNPGTGWAAIIDSTTRPSGSASIFKVAHHGSITGDRDGIWFELLDRGPIAVLTPFVRGNKRLPTTGDARRILNRASESFATGSPKPKKAIKRSSTVTKTIRETVRQIYPVRYASGQIRARKKLSDKNIPWEVTLYGDAIHLRELERVS